MPANNNLPALADFEDKFLLFQECVVAWMFELTGDLHALETSEGKPLDLKNVVRFPGKGNDRRQLKLPLGEGA